MKKPKRALAKLVFILFLAAQFSGLSLLFPKKLDSANLTSVSDTLSNNRLSFRGQLSGAHAVGAGTITLKTSGLTDPPYTSSGSAALMENDSVKIGTNAPTAVKTIETSAIFTIGGTGLTTAASDGGPVIATVSAIHTLSFKAASAIAGGAFRTLIPASTTSTTEPADGLPDKNGFDIVSTSPTISVTCSGGGISDWKTGTATASGQASCTAGYHCLECRYNGTADTSQAVTMQIGSTSTPTVNLINPSPASTSRYPGASDNYTFKVRHTEGIANSYTVADETIGTIAVVEAVRVTATVAPILTFQMAARASATTNCNVAADVSTTPTSVPLGTITTTAFRNAAQELAVTTNAVGGYTVTASESGALSMGGLGVTTIPDTTCTATPCTVTTTADWTSTAYKGFGYALENVSSDNPVPSGIRYNTGGTFMARPFGLTGIQIMTYSGPVDSSRAYVCYRAVVSGIQAAGDYQNYVIYIATATF